MRSQIVHVEDYMPHYNLLPLFTYHILYINSMIWKRPGNQKLESLESGGRIISDKYKLNNKTNFFLEEQ